ncbi:cytochrome P450 [Massariosphaeria phaeospora]|uniref:Cytochrome P450 n=1 Tax=Massariosphaeria phaeospora TaxID=100035 RepID=A0A7C8MCC2_9PLEO|nr:cytochrome P450 [Massariosphaeria phaeospora]
MYMSLILLNVVVGGCVVLVRRYNLLSHLFTVLLRLRYPIRDIETGRSLPTLPFVFPNGQGNIEKYIYGRQNSLKWGLEYGPLYRIWSGFHGEMLVPTHAFSFTRPADIEAVFRDSHTHLKANANDSGYLMHQLLGSCLGLVSGAEWKAIRRATEPPFVRTATESQVQAVEGYAKEHVESLFSSKPGSDSPTRTQLHPHADLRVYPFLALAEILYGGLTPELKARLLAIIPGRDSVFRSIIVGGLTRFPISRFLPLPALRELWDFKKAWACWNDDAHAEALRKSESGETRGAAPIVQMYASVEEGSMSREALLQTLDEMLFANLDVTIGGLAWALVFLAADPQAQSKLRDQIRTEMASEDGRSAYLMSQSNYLHHILLESGRLRPVAAFSVSQSCPTPRRLGNFVFPAGTKFVVDANALNVRDPLWAPDNTAFRPERWQEGGVQRAKDVRYCYWRFGFGPRVCLGKYVVDLMMKALIVELVRGFELKLEDVEGKAWAWEQDTWALDPAMRIACVRRSEERAR